VVDVPALDVTDRARVARVCMGANGRLHKPREASLRTRGHEGHGSFLPQVFVYLFAVPLWCLIRPKGGAHAQPLRSIALDGPADLKRLLFRFGHRQPDGRRDERFFSAASHRAACSSNAGRRPSSDERSSWGGPPSRSIAYPKLIVSKSSTMCCAGLASATRRVSCRKPEPLGSRCRSCTTSIWSRTRSSWSSSMAQPRRTSSIE